MSGRAWLWPAVIAASAVAAGGLVLGEVTSPTRSIVVAWFLVICPGMAIVRLLPVASGVIVLTLAVALSVALDALVAIPMLYAGAWSPTRGLVVLIALSLLGAALQAVAAMDGGLLPGRRGRSGWAVGTELGQDARAMHGGRR